MIAILAMVLFAGCWRESGKNYARPLPDGALALQEVDPAQLPTLRLLPGDRERLRTGIGHSLAWLESPRAKEQYGDYTIAGVTRAQVVGGLKKLDGLLTGTGDDEALTAAIRSQFRVLRSIGCDDRGTVLFTGYYTPILPASRTRDARFKFPLHRRPADLVPTSKPGVAAVTPALRKLPDGSLVTYPERAELESGALLDGQELVWLDDPFAAYLVNVQGSAKLDLVGGGRIEVGYDGTNGHPYHGIGQELVKDGKITADKLSFTTMVAHFRAHPEDVPTYTRRNPRYVFFREVSGGPFGSLGKPVTSDISIATDKSIFPPAALCLVATSLLAPGQQQAGNYAALRLDQDTGGAIRAPGRCDLFMGEGSEAERRAGAQFAEGQLYYLVARE